jgi:hypothetical protein
MFFQDFVNIVPEVALLVMVLHITNVIPVALTHIILQTFVIKRYQ